MALYNHQDGIVQAEQFGVEQLPWPKGVEENKGMGVGVFYSITTPDGDCVVRNGDYVILDGLCDVPDVVPYDEFMDQYTPVPDDVG